MTDQLAPGTLVMFVDRVDGELNQYAVITEFDSWQNGQRRYRVSWVATRENGWRGQIGVGSLDEDEFDVVAPPSPPPGVTTRDIIAAVLEEHCWDARNAPRHCLCGGNLGYGMSMAQHQADVLLLHPFLTVDQS